MEYRVKFTVESSEGTEGIEVVLNQNQYEAAVHNKFESLLNDFKYAAQQKKWKSKL